MMYIKSNLLCIKLENIIISFLQILNTKKYVSDEKLSNTSKDKNTLITWKIFRYDFMTYYYK